jgi:hypothetical protein
MDKNGLLNGQWTMDRDYVAPFRANPNIADPTDLLDPSDPTDLSEKATDQITNPRAISSVKAATLQIFRVFRAFRGQKMGCGRQPTPSFLWFPWLKIGLVLLFRYGVRP